MPSAYLLDAIPSLATCPLIVWCPDRLACSIWWQQSDSQLLHQLQLTVTLPANTLSSPSTASTCLFGHFRDSHCQYTTDTEIHRVYRITRDRETGGRDSKETRTTGVPISGRQHPFQTKTGCLQQLAPISDSFRPLPPALTSPTAIFAKNRAFSFPSTRFDQLHAFSTNYTRFRSFLAAQTCYQS